MVIRGSRKFCGHSRTHCAPRSSLAAAWTLSMRMHVFSAADNLSAPASPQNAADRPFLRSRFFFQFFLFCPPRLSFLAVDVHALIGTNFCVL